MTNLSIPFPKLRWLELERSILETIFRPQPNSVSRLLVRFTKCFC